MTYDGWRKAVLKAAKDEVMLDLVVRLLMEQEAAKSKFSEMGFGCIGMSWVDVVKQVDEFCTDCVFDREHNE